MYTFEDLEILHNQIKNSKYRDNKILYSKYGDGYYNNLQKLLDMVWEMKNDYPQIEKADNFDFYHDFSRAIQLSKFANNVIDGSYKFDEDEMCKETSYEYNKNIIEENTNHIERCLGTLHYFISTHRFDMFYCYYKSKYVRFVWDETKQNFVIGYVLH